LSYLLMRSCQRSLNRLAKNWKVVTHHDSGLS
jgi:hypothetical protein